MSVATITNTITDGSGAAVAGVTVIARLRPGPGFRVSGSTEIADVSAVTNGAGLWSLALEKVANVDPAGSYWEIEEQVPGVNGGPRLWNIGVVTSGSLYANLLINLATVAALPTALTMTAGDARYAQLGANSWAQLQTFAAGVATTTLAASGAVTAATTLAVTGAVTFASTLTATGMAAFGSSLTAAGAAAITGKLTLSGGLDVASTAGEVLQIRTDGVGNITLFATGTDTNVSVFLRAKGAGVVNLQDPAGIGRVVVSSAGNVCLSSVIATPTGAAGCILIGSTASPPSGTPVGGGVLYVTAGALMYKGTSGTVTTLAPV